MSTICFAIWAGPRAYGLDTYHHYETRVLRRKMNWKLGVDTLRDLSPAASASEHGRPAVLQATARRSTRRTEPPADRARRTLDQLRGIPEDQWDVFDHTVVICVLFPNTNLHLPARPRRNLGMLFPGTKSTKRVIYVSLYIPSRSAIPRPRRIGTATSTS